MCSSHAAVNDFSRGPDYCPCTHNNNNNMDTKRRLLLFYNSPPPSYGVDPNGFY